MLCLELLSSLGKKDVSNRFVCASNCVEKLKGLSEMLEEEFIHGSRTYDVARVLGNMRAVETHFIPVLQANMKNSEIAFWTCKIVVAITAPLDATVSYRQELLENLRAIKQFFVARVHEQSREHYTYGLARNSCFTLPRSEESPFDKNLVEVCLVLVRNILLIADVPTRSSGSGGHDALLGLLKEHFFFETLILITQSFLVDISWLRAILEVFCLLFHKETMQGLYSCRVQAGRKSMPKSMPPLLQHSSSSEPTLNTSSVRPLFARRNAAFLVEQMGTFFVTHNVSSGAPNIRLPVTTVTNYQRGSPAIWKRRVSAGVSNRPTKGGFSALSMQADLIPSSTATKQLLWQFGIDFIEAAYDKMMRTIWPGLSSIEAHRPLDVSNFIRAIEISSGIWYYAHKSGENKFQCDVVSFNLLLETFIWLSTKLENCFIGAESSETILTNATGALAYTLALLQLMSSHGDDMHNNLSLRMQLKLFHEKDIILDRIKQLLSRFDSSKHYLSYLENVTVAVDVLLELLHSLSSMHMLVLKAKKPKKRRTTKKPSENDADAELPVSDPESSKIEYDRLYKYETYLSEIGSNNNISTYCMLLQSPGVSWETISRVTRFFRRLASLKAEGGIALFYKLSIFRVFADIMDTFTTMSGEATPEQKDLEQFITLVSSSFFALAKENPILYLKVLFWPSRAERRMMTGVSNGETDNAQYFSDEELDKPKRKRKRFTEQQIEESANKPAEDTNIPPPVKDDTDEEDLDKLLESITESQDAPTTTTTTTSSTTPSNSREDNGSPPDD
ncbi:hypothetical protein Pelo_2334 [Pelomyxa schiedti]|nr:hypothetical protein Pelo_2334 [Pelomyxa schiedti]